MRCDMCCQIMIVDDHRFAREAVTELLGGYGEFEVAGQASTGTEAVKLALKTKPDVILMDVHLPGMNGIAATHRIANALPHTRVVAFSQQNSPNCVRQMIQAGAMGYVCKEDGIEDLVEAIRHALDGKPYMSRSLSSLALVDYFQVVKGETMIPEATSLTQREIEIVQFITDGHSSREVGEQLGITQKTVDNHRHRIMDKLGIHSIAELTKWAIREGLTTP